MYYYVRTKGTRIHFTPDMLIPLPGRYFNHLIVEKKIPIHRQKGKWACADLIMRSSSGQHTWHLPVTSITYILHQWMCAPGHRSTYAFS